MASFTKEYPMTSASVDEISEVVYNHWIEQKLKARDALRCRLSVEEVLLNVMEHGASESVQLAVGSLFSRRSVTLRYGGAAFDPTQGSEQWSSRILESLGLSPSWSYRQNTNIVQFRPVKPQSPNQLVLLLIGAVLAVLCGAAGNLLPETARQSITDILLTPLFESFLGLLNTFAGALIFLTVSSGVFGIGDTTSLSRIGKVMFTRFFGSAVLTALLSLAVALPFFHLASAAQSQTGSELQSISQMLFGILPENLVKPLLYANTMQIVVLAIFTGVILLSLGERVRLLSELIEELGIVLQRMMGVVCSLIPVFVFVSLLRMIWSGEASNFASLWKPFCLYIAVEAAATLLTLLSASLPTKTSPLLLLKKSLPGFLIAFTTGSSMAAYSTSVDSCKKKMGIHSKLVDFAFPIGVVVYMPCAVITFIILACYLGEMYAVEVSASWFVMAILVSAILSVACPPVPGAMLTCYGILLAQLGIPSDGLVFAVMLNVVLDFFMTGFDVLKLEFEITREADLLHMLDREKLHEKLT